MRRAELVFCKASAQIIIVGRMTAFLGRDRTAFPVPSVKPQQVCMDGAKKEDRHRLKLAGNPKEFLKHPTTSSPQFLPLALLASARFLHWLLPRL